MSFHDSLSNERNDSMRTTRSKNRILAHPGYGVVLCQALSNRKSSLISYDSFVLSRRAPWYTVDGTPLEAYVIAIAGGSASGKVNLGLKF